MTLGGFREESKGIFRLKILFEAIYTSVFLIEAPSGAILVDCGAGGEDVDRFIVPAIREAGREISDIRTLVLTHKHGDHAGGLERILSLAENIEVIADVRELHDGIYTYCMAGHTDDSIGILDTRSHTLISGDGLQGAGIDKYRRITKNPSAYRETIEKIKNDGRIENILFSHAYEPWNKDGVFGRRAVDACLSECIKYLEVKE